ncbi:Acg family FMN-binding oxidoreductase [Aquipuribacter sp. MA13-6]|uniref:Acg family FMN-binding oxidoreductase n=1 Tax=unclassified Aquipuribacter TaxID=2635084 RepID=UPI003EE8AE5D
MDVHRSHVHAMAEAARHAPSVHNTQPWRLLSRPDGLVVVVDETRALPELDPTGRLRTISCGAAVANAALASRALGYGTRVQLLPDGPRGGTVARLVVVAPRTPTPAELRLTLQISRRRTHRVVHPDEPVPDDLLGDLAGTVADEGASLTVLDLPSRRVLAGLLVRASRQQEHRPDLLREMRAWVREPVRGRRGGLTDGVLRSSLATAPRGVGALPVERSHGPRDVGATSARLLGSTVVALSTLTDTRRDHVVTGIAMQRMLLHLTALDLVAAFADQATEVPDTRDQLSALLARPGQVQLVLQLGRALVDVRVPPRRPLHDVLDGPPPAPRTVIDLTETHERTSS